MREIKYRAWDIDNKEMYYDVQSLYDGNIRFSESRSFSNRCFGDLIEAKEKIVLMQYTGLKDKNRLQEVYEGDIIDTYGNIKGNIYEIKKVDKDRYDLVIQGFGTKDWLTTYQNAVDRGCKDSE